MHRRLTRLTRLGLVALAGIAAMVVGLLLASPGDEDAPIAKDPSDLDTRSLTAGDVDVEIQPRQLDDQGATFAITLDTHSVELSADLTEATLQVGDTAWTGARWSGDGPGGHHREGELRFESTGPASGPVRLTLPGLPDPVEATWDLGDSRS